MRYFAIFFVAVMTAVFAMAAPVGTKATHDIALESVLSADGPNLAVHESLDDRTRDILIRYTRQ